MFFKPWASTILQSETNAVRFEEFCNQVLAKTLGRTVLSTSRTWDGGRDGVGIGTARPTYVATTLSSRRDKPAADVQTIVATLAGRSADLYYCLQRSLSDVGEEELRTELLAELPEGSDTTVLSLDKLAQLAVDHEDIFRFHYAGELETLRSTLAGTGVGDEGQEHAMRLALMTAASDESETLRLEAYRAAIMASLADDTSRNPSQIARDVSQALRLSGMIPNEAMAAALRGLADSGDIELSDKGYRLSASGRSALETMQDDAGSRLLLGRTVIRDRLEASIGWKLADSQFNQLWKVIQDTLSAEFYKRGQDLVRSVAAVLSRSDGSSTTEPLAFVEPMSDRCARCSSLSDQQDEIRLAVRDLFREPTGAAFDWLVQLCANFVILCSLGLEVRSGQAIAAVLSRLRIVVDTDVLLSQLSVGEPDHASIDQIRTRLLALGAKVLVADSVRREVQRHVEIAGLDYNSVADWLPGSAEDRLRLIGNAFVRGFAELLVLKRARPHQWHAYIDTFRTTKSYDGLVSELADLGIDFLPRSPDTFRRLEQDVFSFVLTRLHPVESGHDQAIVHDKARRDAALYADLVSYEHDMQTAGDEFECLLVSSARRLVEVDQQFDRLAQPHSVVTIGTLLHLLMLVPGVSVTLPSLKAFLFEGAKFKVHDKFERLVLRVLKRSDEVSLPFAKRRRPTRAVKDGLLRGAIRADQQGPRHLTKQLVRAAQEPAQDGNRAADVIVDALREAGVWTKKDEEIARLKRELATKTGRQARNRRP